MKLSPSQWFKPWFFLFLVLALKKTKVLRYVISFSFWSFGPDPVFYFGILSQKVDFLLSFFYNYWYPSINFYSLECTYNIAFPINQIRAKNCLVISVEPQLMFTVLLPSSLMKLLLAQLEISLDIAPSLTEVYRRRRNNWPPILHHYLLWLNDRQLSTMM